MSDLGDTDGVLHHFVTGDNAERLLAGRADGGDDGLATVDADHLVARMTAAVREGGTQSAPASRRRFVLAQLVTAKVAAFAAVALFSAGAAAAATGNLPDPVQRTVSNTFSHVGVDLPSPADKPDTTTTTASPTTSTTAGESDSTTTAITAAHAAVGPGATGAAKTGLCTAYFANAGHGNSHDAVAFANLTKAATAAGQTVEQFCAPATDTTTTTATTSTRAATSPTSASADPGNSGSSPAVTAPGRTSDPGNSGSTPAATAPDRQNAGDSGSTPAATAPGRGTSPTSAHGRP